MKSLMTYFHNGDSNITGSKIMIGKIIAMVKAGHQDHETTEAKGNG